MAEAVTYTDLSLAPDLGAIFENHDRMIKEYYDPANQRERDLRQRAYWSNRMKDPSFAKMIQLLQGDNELN